MHIIFSLLVMIFLAVYHRCQWVFGWVPLPPVRLESPSALDWKCSVDNGQNVVYTIHVHTIQLKCSKHNWIQCCPHTTPITCTLSNWASRLWCMDFLCNVELEHCIGWFCSGEGNLMSGGPDRDLGNGMKKCKDWQGRPLPPQDLIYWFAFFNNFFAF